MSFFSGQTSPDPAMAGRIKEWVRRSFNLPSDAVVMVSELRCSEPGCPPLETVVAILNGPGNRQQAKLHLPLAEVTERDVAGLKFA
jgi:hypothetical protein